MYEHLPHTLDSSFRQAVPFLGRAGRSCQVKRILKMLAPQQVALCCDGRSSCESACEGRDCSEQMPLKQDTAIGIKVGGRRVCGACKRCVRLAKESVIHQVALRSEWPSARGHRPPGSASRLCVQGLGHGGSSSTGPQPPLVHCFVVFKLK